MRCFFIFLFILICSFGVNAQLIDSKFNITFGVNRQYCNGNNDYLSNMTSKPYLIGESIKSTAIMLGFDYKFNKVVSAGLNISNAFFDEWGYRGELNILDRKSLNITSLKPEFQFCAKKKIFKSILVSFNLSPSINKIKTDFTHEYSMLIIDNNGESERYINDLIISEYHFGVDVGIRLKFDFSDYYGIFLKSGYNKIFLSNSYFKENAINSYYIQFGVNIRIKPNFLVLNKRYNY